MNYIRYRFKTYYADCRPEKDMAKINMPWWCTGGNDDFSVIVCYLPKNEKLSDYWDDADEIETQECDEIIYTSRFTKPDWIKE